MAVSKAIYCGHVHNKMEKTGKKLKKKTAAPFNERSGGLLRLQFFYGVTLSKMPVASTLLFPLFTPSPPR